MIMGNRFASARHRCRKWLMDNAYLITLGAIIAIVVSSAVYTRSVQKQSGIAAAAPAPEIVKESTQTPPVSPLPTIAPLAAGGARLSLTGGTVWPVAGRVIRAYDDQTPVYWQSLSSVRVHAALDIAGEGGEAVCAAADGTVESVSRDALWGWRVTVRQTDGRQAVYAGLSSVAVARQQRVTRGQEIGVLMERIPCEAELGPHLHMELYRDGKPQDPEGMMPERRR